MAIYDDTHMRMHTSALIDQKARVLKDIVAQRIALSQDEKREPEEFVKMLDWDVDPNWLKEFFIVGRLERLSSLHSVMHAIKKEMKKALGDIEGI